MDTIKMKLEENLFSLYTCISSSSPAQLMLQYITVSVKQISVKIRKL